MKGDCPESAAAEEWKLSLGTLEYGSLLSTIPPTHDE
jgi:hypothetical protein